MKPKPSGRRLSAGKGMTYTDCQRMAPDLPWIETVTLAEEEGWGKNPAYLHYGSAGVIGIETNADAAAKLTQSKD